MKKALYIFWQCTWGLPQTLVGLAVLLICRKAPHYFYHGAVVTHWRAHGGVSLGMFIFINTQELSPRARPAAQGRPAAIRHAAPADGLLLHEYGHTLQSLLLGPAYLALVGLPSFIWARLPHFNRLRRRRGISYYRVWPESWADRLGAVAAGRWKTVLTDAKGEHSHGNTPL